MDRVTLGSTGLEVSVAGLGTGGPSRVGSRHSDGPSHAVDLVRRALDLGITFVDTAPGYDTEEIVGEALSGRRDEVVLSTKVRVREHGGERTSAALMRSSVEESLRALRTDRIDVLHFHALRPSDYDYAIAEVFPILVELRDEGSVRFLAVSEEFSRDTDHTMLQRALTDGLFDVVMVGFNLLNPSARELVLPECRERGVGAEVMYAVRRALSSPERLRAVVGGLVEAGDLPADALDAERPLEFLLEAGGARSIPEASYRFARHEADGAVILTGTGSFEHLAENVAAINAPPLRDADAERLRALFGSLATLTGD